MYRTKTSQKSYRKGGCPFCATNEEKIYESKKYIILKNRFAYSFWDLCGVSDHLLLLPKKHVIHLKRDPEFCKIVDSYEKKGYNIYTRGAGSPIKTVEHHHTHLIKPGKRKTFMLYLKKPYIRLTNPPKRGKI